MAVYSSDEIRKQIEKSIEVKKKILGDEGFLDKIEMLVNDVVEAYRKGNKVIFAGNGGSAADSQHLAAEFVSRFEFDRPGLPAISLSTDTSMLTAISNDYGYEKLFTRQLEAQGIEGDFFVGISTSGKSPNVLAALATAKQKNIKTVLFCGEGGEIDKMADYVFRVPSRNTARIQESHILIGHILCGGVEKLIFADNFLQK